MSIRTTTCHIVFCDGCGDEDFGGEYIPHHASAAEAENYAETEFLIATADGKHYCSQCIAKGEAPAEVLAAAKAAAEADKAATMAIVAARTA
jgi:hypothetical protein